MATLWRHVVKGVFQNKIDEGRQAAVDPVACQKILVDKHTLHQQFLPQHQ